MSKFFSKGLIALLPIVVTILVLKFIIEFLYVYVAVPIGGALKWSLEVGFVGGETLDPHIAYNLLGLALAIVLTLVFGFIVATFLGKKLFQLFEWIVKKVPVIRTIYPYAKQFIEFFVSGDRKVEFKHAVAVPFPTPGIYSIGFVTGDGLKALNEATGKHLPAVFVPTSPTPFTGYVLYVPREDIIPLPLSVEEAMRILISAGVLSPTHQTVPSMPLTGPGSRFDLPDEMAKAIADGKDPKKP